MALPYKLLSTENTYNINSVNKVIETMSVSQKIPATVTYQMPFCNIILSFIPTIKPAYHEVGTKLELHVL